MHIRGTHRGIKRKGDQETPGAGTLRQTQRELVTTGLDWRISPRTEHAGSLLLIASAPYGIYRLE